MDAVLKLVESESEPEDPWWERIQVLVAEERHQQLVIGLKFVVPPKNIVSKLLAGLSDCQCFFFDLSVSALCLCE